MTTPIHFSPREKDILNLIAKATSRKRIADALNLKENTISTHLKSIHLKTNTHSMVELVRWAILNMHSEAKIIQLSEKTNLKKSQKNSVPNPNGLTYLN